jgi:hypothetical protein
MGSGLHGYFKDVVLPVSQKRLRAYFVGCAEIG